MSNTQALFQYPYIDENGVSWNDKILYYSGDARKVRCLETGRIYDKAIEVLPCNKTYVIVENSQEE